MKNLKLNEAWVHSYLLTAVLINTALTFAEVFGACAIVWFFKKFSERAE
jgi:hypothetical protein